MGAEFMQQPFPRPLLLGAAALLGFTMLAVALRSGSSATIERAPVVASAALRFSDRADGAILVRDAASGDTVATLEPGNGGFVRAALRALSRDRKLANAQPDAPFLLQRGADGRLRLLDTTNDRIVDLAAFGPTNSGAFAKLLPTESHSP